MQRLEIAFETLAGRGHRFDPEALIEHLERQLADGSRMAIVDSDATQTAATLETIRRETDADGLKPLALSHPREARPGWVPWAVALSAAAIVLVLIGGVAILLGGGDTVAPVGSEPVVETTIPPAPSTTTATAPSTTTITSPSTTTATAPSIPPASLSSLDAWQQVGAEVMQPAVSMTGITPLGSGFVAVGFEPDENGRQDGAVFSSQDGIAWIRMAEDDEALTTGAVLMFAVAEGGPGIVAVGYGCEDEPDRCPPYATVWSSADGTEWTRTPLDFDVFGEGSGMYDVVASPHGIVAVGATENWVSDELVRVRPSVWISSDGLDWVRAWDGPETERDVTVYGQFDVQMQAVTAATDGILVAVGSMLDDQGAAVAAVWTSSDGVTWDRVPHDPAIFGGDGELELTMWDVVADTSGFVAVGGERRSGVIRPALWTSPDGFSWSRVDLDSATADFVGPFGNVTVGGEGLVVTGPVMFEGFGQVTVWTSANGSDWDRIAELGNGNTSAIITTDQAVLVSGAMGGPYQAAVWAGPATPTPG